MNTVVKIWFIDLLDLPEFEARGIRKLVTIGIIDLWQTSVHSDVAFL